MMFLKNTDNISSSVEFSRLENKYLKRFSLQYVCLKSFIIKYFTVQTGP